MNALLQLQLFITMSQILGRCHVVSVVNILIVHYNVFEVALGIGDQFEELRLLFQARIHLFLDLIDTMGLMKVLQILNRFLSPHFYHLLPF